MGKKRQPGYTFTEQKFVNYLTKARTLDAVVRKFKLPPAEVLKCIRKGYKHYDLFEPLNEYNEQMYILVKKPATEIVLEPRKIKTRHSEGEEAYIQIQIADKLDELRIVPLCDAHYGNKGHRSEKFRKYIDWIKRTDGVYAFVMGDMNESKTETGKGHIYDQDTDPHQQINDMTVFLSEIAHKVLAMVPGNHEWQIYRKTGVDVTKIMAERLGIPYFQGGTHIHILWKGRRYGFKIFHGKGNSQTKGGKMNAAIRSKIWTEGIDFFLSGHTHDCICQPQTKFVPDLPNCRLIEKTYWTVVAPSFLGYWNTYAHRADFQPPAKGGVACVLYPDGTYRAEFTAGY